MQAEVHPDPQIGAREVIRETLLDQSGLVRALASGRLRGRDQPPYLRIELRYVDLKGHRHLQITEYDERQAHTRNVAGPDVEKTVDELLDLPYGTWHIETTTETLRLRYTKKGKELLHRQADSREQET